MISKKLTNKITLGPLPASKKIYVQSEKFSDVKVAMREIALTNNTTFTVYDPSGVYSDQNFLDKIDLNKGLPKLRQQWINERGDVEEYQGRIVKPEDNGVTAPGAKPSAPEFDLSEFKPVRAKAGKKQAGPNGGAYAVGAQLCGR
jgi:phosphomethylpyrimidine synthase